VRSMSCSSCFTQPRRCFPVPKQYLDRCPMLNPRQRLRCEPPRERSVNSACRSRAPANPRSDLRFDAALSGGIRFPSRVLKNTK